MTEQRKISPAILVYFMIFLTPFSMYGHKIVGDIGVVPINTYAIALFPFFCIICLLRNRLPNITIVGVLLLLYVLVASISALFAVNKLPALQIAGVYFLKFFLCFVYPIYFLNTRKQVEKAVYIFIFVGLLNAVMGWIELVGFTLFDEMFFPPFAQYFAAKASTKNFGFGTGAFGIPGFMRMFGFFGAGSNFFGPYTVIPFGLSVYCALKFKNFFLRCLPFFFFLTILFSASRSGLLGSFVLIGFAFLFIRYRKTHFYPVITRSYAILIVIFILLLGSYILVLSDFYFSSQVAVTSKVTIGTPMSLLERLNPFATNRVMGTWNYFYSHLVLALDHGFDNFGFGRGGGNFDEFVYRLYPVKFGSHSNFILFLGDTGIWGLLVQMAVILTTIVFGMRAYYNQSHEKRDQLPLFLTAIFTGLAMCGFVRTHYQDTYTFIVMGLIVKLYILSRVQTSKEHVSSQTTNQ